MTQLQPPPVPIDVLDQLEVLGVSRESRSRLDIFVSLLFRWQAQINLISPATLPLVWHRHVLDSLQILPLLPKQATHIIDLGSGSGFPGLPLAIASGRHVDLYESNNKKCAFLSEALRQAKAIGTVHHLRLPLAFKPAAVRSGQIITARASAPLNELLSLAEPFLRAGATGLFHKGQDADTELTEAQKYWKINYETHPSLTDSKAVILEVREVSRV